MKSSCALCEREGLEKRVFYDSKNWYAFLAAPPFARGHTILARKKSDAGCPKMLLREHLLGIDSALADVVDVIRRHYDPKDVLVASLRGKEPHVHWHLIPLWQDQERDWRLKSRYKTGHLFEYLADIDQVAQTHALDERLKHDWTAEEQQVRLTEQFQPDVLALRATVPRRQAARE